MIEKAANNTMFGHAYAGNRWKVCGALTVMQYLYWHRSEQLIQFYVEPYTDDIAILDPKEHDTIWKRYYEEAG